MPPSISTAHRVRYANGYMELGMMSDAAEELENIVPSDRSLAAVIEAWIDVHMATEQWAFAAVLAQELTQKSPSEPKGWISWAFSVRRLDGLREAEAILLDAEKRIGATCALVHYNLACYRCVSGDLPAAWERLRTAFRMDPAWKGPALHDPDLAALRDKIIAHA